MPVQYATGVLLVLLALLLYVIGFYLASYPDAHHRGYSALTYAWACLCAICILSYILFSDDISVAAPDFIHYYEWYQALARNRNSGHFELGFYALARLFASSSVPLTVFLSVIAAFVMLSVYRLVKRTIPSHDTALALFVYFNFFAFYNIIFNVIRSGMSVACIIFSIIFLMDRRFLASLSFILLATSFHRTGIFGLVIFLALISRLSLWHLVVINLGLFVTSMLGVNEALGGNVLMHLGTIAEKWDLYTGPYWVGQYPARNRVDFLIFTMFPFVLHVALFRLGKDNLLTSGLDDAHLLMKIYLLLMLPFSFFAFMPISDRYALFCWILWPVVTAAPLLYSRSLPPIERIVLRLVIVAILVGTPNIVQYQTTLLTLSIALQDTAVRSKIW